MGFGRGQGSLEIAEGVVLLKGFSDRKSTIRADLVALETAFRRKKTASGDQE